MRKRDLMKRGIISLIGTRSLILARSESFFKVALGVYSQWKRTVVINMGGERLPKMKFLAWNMLSVVPK